MPQFVSDLFYQWNITNENDEVMLFVLVAVSLVVLVLRVVLALGYQSKMALVALSTKEIKAKEDIANLKLAPFAKIAKEYAALGDRGINKVDTKTLVEKQALTFHFLLWNYKSMERFILSFENSMLFIGILFVFLAQNQMALVVVSVSAFLLLKFFASLFDFLLAKEQYIAKTSYAIDKEVGRFYLTDNASAVTTMARELRNTIAAQSKTISDSVEKMGQDMSKTLEHSMETMAQNIDSTMKNISSYTSDLEKPMESWRQNLTLANEAQAKINQSLDSLNLSINNFAVVSGGMGNTFSDYKTELQNSTKLTLSEMKALNQAIDNMSEIAKNLANKNDVIEQAIAEQKANHELMTKSLAQYENTLQDITTKLGTGLATIVDFHLKESYSKLSEGIGENLKTISANNQELLTRLQSLFAQMQEQSHAETAAIVSIKEQMDVQFASLSQTTQQ